MRAFARQLYSSKAWQHTRNAYRKYRGGLCENCLRHGRYTAGQIVHHKVWLTPENINDESVTLNFDNLELLCRECHAAVHEDRRWSVDEFGRVTVR